MKKIILLSIIIVISLSSFAYADDLSDYPDIFINGGKFDAYIVVGNKDPASYVLLQSKLITALSQYTGKTITGKAKLASEIDDLDQNLIIFGSPCQNELSNLLDGYPLDCDLLDSKAGIFLVEVEGSYHLILTGGGDDIKKEVDMLVNFEDEELENDELIMGDVKPKVDDTKKVIDESEKMIAELNKKIANKSTFEQKPVLNETKEEPKVIQIQENQAATLEQKSENPGIFKRFFNWLAGLFK